MTTNLQTIPAKTVRTFTLNETEAKFIQAVLGQLCQSDIKVMLQLNDEKYKAKGWDNLNCSIWDGINEGLSKRK